MAAHQAGPALAAAGGTHRSEALNGARPRERAPAVGALRSHFHPTHRSATSATPTSGSWTRGRAGGRRWQRCAGRGAGGHPQTARACKLHKPLGPAQPRCILSVAIWNSRPNLGLSRPSRPLPQQSSSLPIVAIILAAVLAFLVVRLGRDWAPPAPSLARCNQQTLCQPLPAAFGRRPAHAP